jgi:hypothetical protein
MKVKLCVVSEDGEQEIIELALPVKFEIGPELWTMQDANGMDHYFDMNGFYDGWGKMIPLHKA